MEEPINPSPVPSNCTSPVCSDPAHDDLALDSEWSDEDRDCVGDGPHRVVEDPEDLDVPDVRVREDEDQEVQQVLLRFSGAHAPEILIVIPIPMQYVQSIYALCHIPQHRLTTYNINQNLQSTVVYILSRRRQLPTAHNEVAQEVVKCNCGSSDYRQLQCQ